jgi:hypothetical protein
MLHLFVTAWVKASECNGALSPLFSQAFFWHWYGWQRKKAVRIRRAGTKSGGGDYSKCSMVLTWLTPLPILKRHSRTAEA